MTGLHIVEGVCAKKLGTTYLIDLETKSGIWGFFLGVRVWRREEWKWNISGVRKGRWSVKGLIMGKDVRMFTEFCSITSGLLEHLHRLTRWIQFLQFIGSLMLLPLECLVHGCKHSIVHPQT